MKKEYESPVYHVRRVPVEKVRANSYNPNHYKTTIQWEEHLNIEKLQS